jgi:uroporphyrinogen-III synthase
VLDALADAGMDGVCLPTITVAPVADTGKPDGPLDAALRRLPDYHYAVFASANGARLVATRMIALGIQVPDSLRVVAGPATAQVLAAHGLRASIVPAPFSAAAALTALRHEPMGLAGKRVFLARGDRGGDELSRGLRAAGAVADEVVVYRTQPVHEQPALVAALVARQVDAIAFFSPSAVEGCAAALRHARHSPADVGTMLGRVVVACIGTTTAAAAQDQGWRVDVVAADTTAQSLAAGLAARLVRAWKATEKNVA